MVPHQPDEDVGTALVEPDAHAQRGRRARAYFRVVTRAPLADVVEERAQQEEVGARTPCDVTVEVVGLQDRRALGNRFERVTIDGEAVVGVPLRTRAHVRPFR